MEKLLGNDTYKLRNLKNDDSPGDPCDVVMAVVSWIAAMAVVSWMDVVSCVVKVWKDASSSETSSD